MKIFIASAQSVVVLLQLTLALLNSQEPSPSTEAAIGVALFYGAAFLILEGVSLIILCGSAVLHFGLVASPLRSQLRFEMILGACAALVYPVYMLLS